MTSFWSMERKTVLVELSRVRLPPSAAQIDTYLCDLDAFF